MYSTANVNRGFERHQPPYRAGKSLRKRVRMLEKHAIHTEVVNGTSSTLYEWSARHALAGQSSVTQASVNLDGVTKIRFTDIAHGTGEANRAGERIIYKGVYGELYFAYIGLLPASSEVELTPKKKLPVRIMIVQVLDEIGTTTAGINLPPTLSDMIGNLPVAFGNETNDGPLAAYELMNGQFKPIKPDLMPDTAAVERLGVRQRQFKVWFDKKIVLRDDNTHDGTMSVPAEAKISADGGAAAGTVQWTSGIQRSTTNAALGDVDRFEKYNAKIKIVPIRCPMNTPVDYLLTSTQAISEVKGNVYLYVFCLADETNETQLAAADWPTANGAATLAQTRIPQAIMRYRFKHYWIDA